MFEKPSLVRPWGSLSGARVPALLSSFDPRACPSEGLGSLLWASPGSGARGRPTAPSGDWTRRTLLSTGSSARGLEP